MLHKHIVWFLQAATPAKAIPQRQSMLASPLIICSVDAMRTHMISVLVPWQPAHVMLSVAVPERKGRPAIIQVPLLGLHCIQRSVHENTASATFA